MLHAPEACKPLISGGSGVLAQGLLRSVPHQSFGTVPGSNSLNNLTILREGQLIEEIALLHRRMSNWPHANDVRTKCAQTYLRELLRFKQESLELLRYQRAGRGARWQRRPELH